MPSWITTKHLISADGNKLLRVFHIHLLEGISDYCIFASTNLIILWENKNIQDMKSTHLKWDFFFLAVNHVQFSYR